MTNDDQNDEKLEEKGYAGSTIDVQLEIQRLEKDLEAKDLESELALAKLETKHLKREIRGLKDKLADKNPTNADIFLQFLLFFGSLILVESISIFLSLHFVDDLILFSFAAVGGVIVGAIAVYRILTRS